MIIVYGVHIIIMAISLLLAADSYSCDIHMINIHDTKCKIERHIGVLEQFNTKNKQFKLLTLKPTSRFFDPASSYEFNHELIRICVKKMSSQESLDPLFAMWRFFVAEYIDVQGDLFLYELSILLYSIYATIFERFLGMRSEFKPKVEPQDSSQLKDLIALYTVVKNLPIGELLSALDKCLDQFVVIMHDYGMDDDMSWIEWLQRYWWVPPVFATSIVVSCLNVLAQSH